MHEFSLKNIRAALAYRLVAKNKNTKWKSLQIHGNLFSI
jgi:hypothetical protein